jgi:hypothetical protein
LVHFRRDGRVFQQTPKAHAELYYLPAIATQMDKSLYILAGASCSGKSTLLQKWRNGTLDLFGDASCGSNDRAEMLDRIPVLDMHQYQIWADSSRAAPKIILHIDLSSFFKSEYIQSDGLMWSRRLRHLYVSDQIPGAVAISAYWQLAFAGFSSSSLGLGGFSQIVISTVYCKFREARRRKLNRDLEKLKSSNGRGRRRRFVFDRLYTETVEARQNYRDHYVGWNHFVNSLERFPVRKMIWNDRPNANPELSVFQSVML